MHTYFIKRRPHPYVLSLFYRHRTCVTYLKTVLCGMNLFHRYLGLRHSARLGKIKVGGLCKLLKKERPHHFLNIIEPWGLRPHIPYTPSLNI